MHITSNQSVGQSQRCGWSNEACLLHSCQHKSWSCPPFPGLFSCVVINVSFIIFVVFVFCYILTSKNWEY